MGRGARPAASPRRRHGGTRADHVEELRQTKDDGEVAALRRACRIGDQAFAALVGWARPGMTEREVAVRLERTMVDLGGREPSFDTIVAAGPHSAVPHHRPGERKLRPGDLLKVDFGALVDGYHSDMTRTVAIGEPDARLRRVHDVVREAQAAGPAAVVSGTGAAEVDRTCRDVIDAAGHRDHFLGGEPLSDQDEREGDLPVGNRDEASVGEESLGVSRSSVASDYRASSSTDGLDGDCPQQLAVTLVSTPHRPSHNGSQ